MYDSHTLKCILHIHWKANVWFAYIEMYTSHTLNIHYVQCMLHIHWTLSIPLLGDTIPVTIRLVYQSQLQLGWHIFKTLNPMHTCIHTYTHTHVQTHVRIYVYTWTYVYEHAYTYTRSCMCTYNHYIQWYSI